MQSIFQFLKLHRYTLYLILLLCLSALFSTALLLNVPPVWPDEVIYADITNTFLSKGYFGTDLFHDAFPGVNNHIVGYPIMMFLILAGWLKIFGLSIVAQRLLSVVVSLGFLIVLFLFTSAFLKNTYAADKMKHHRITLAALCAVILDTIFLEASRISRPEIFILFFGTTALYLFQKYLQNHRAGWLLGAGMFASFAFLTHFIGGFFLCLLLVWFVYEYKLRVLLTPKLYLFGAAFLGPVILWLMTIWQDYALHLKYIDLAFADKTRIIPWVIAVFDLDPVKSMLVLCHLAITVIFIIYTCLYRSKSKMLLATFLLFVWSLVFFARMHWYYVIVLPFVYVALALLLVDLPFKFFKKPFAFRNLLFLTVAVIACLLGVINLSVTFKHLREKYHEPYGYPRYTQDLLANIEDHKAVFISAVPDPYYGFKKNNRMNILYQSPPLNLSTESLLRLLDSADYIVFNTMYGYTGTVFLDYMAVNQQMVTPIGNGRYHAKIIKLKPMHERITLVP